MTLMSRAFGVVMFGAVLLSGTAGAQLPDQETAIRELTAALNEVGAEVSVDFQRNQQNPNMFAGTMQNDVVFTDRLEIYAEVMQHGVIEFRVYPIVNGGYLGIDSVADPAGLARSLLVMSNQNFFYSALDPDQDVYFGFAFTLESGVPHEAVKTVVRSIFNLDGIVQNLQQYF